MISWKWPKDEWLITRQAAYLFFLSALCVLALPAALMRAQFAPWIRIPLDALGYVIPIGVLLLFISMWRYWIRMDDSRTWVKRGWFLVLLFGFWWGSVLYYFLAYLPQVLRRERAQS
jgi:hypothetical protein